MQAPLFAQLTVIFALLCCLASAQQDNVTIVIGPVIGKVTNSTARVLFEFNASTIITVTLTDPNGTQFNNTKNVTANRAVPFNFSGLQAETKYTVSLSLNGSITNMIESYFTTLGGPTGKLNFAVLSCMDRFVQADKEDEADLWQDMLTRIQNNEVQYLLQTGDQLYMDDPF